MGRCVVGRCGIAVAWIACGVVGIASGRVLLIFALLVVWLWRVCCVAFDVG